MKKYPLAKPYITSEEIDHVTRVLKSGVLSLGPENKEFEQKFAEKMGVKYACSVSSGTAGLHLTMLAAGIGSGDEVITTPFSFVASGNSILYVGATPVFVDIDPVTYNIDPSKIEEKITEKTKAILVVHIFGQAVDMDSIMRLAEKFNLKIIEDACESIGATYKERLTGTFGESSVFAFYPNKQMTTGEGGMIATNSKEIYETCTRLKNQGRGDNMQWLGHDVLGYNYRLDEMSAALGVVQLNKLDFLIEERRKVAQLYTKYLGGHSNILQVPRVAEENTHTWFVYVITIKKLGIDRNKLIERLSERGVSTKPYLPSIHLLPFYESKFGSQRGMFPISERISNTSLALPIYIGLTEDDIAYITDTLLTAIQSYAQ